MVSFKNMEYKFKLEGSNYVCSLDKAPSFCDMKVLLLGGVYAGSSVLSLLHPEITPGDVDIFFEKPRSYHNFIELMKHMFTVTNVVDDYMDIGSDFFGAVIETDGKEQIIVTEQPFEHLANDLDKYFDIDKCAARIYIDDKGVIKFVIPADTTRDPYSRYMFWNKTVAAESPAKIRHKRYEKYVKRGFLLAKYTKSE